LVLCDPETNGVVFTSDAVVVLRDDDAVLREDIFREDVAVRGEDNLLASRQTFPETILPNPQTRSEHVRMTASGASRMKMIATNPRTKYDSTH
jgi:hypothetical protein